MEKSVVIIKGDMIKSRQLKERDLFWSNFVSSISRINNEFKNHLVYQIEITKGDEIVGQCTTLRNAYIVASKLIECLHPFRIRIVISEGQIEHTRKVTKINEMDGRVFWDAATALEQLKQNKRFFKILSENIDVNSILSSLADIITELKYNWTAKEKEIIQLYDSLENQEKVARELKISQQSVSDGLRRSKYKIIRESEKNLIEFV